MILVVTRGMGGPHRGAPIFLPVTVRRSCTGSTSVTTSRSASSCKLVPFTPSPSSATDRRGGDRLSLPVGGRTSRGRSRPVLAIRVSRRSRLSSGAPAYVPVGSCAWQDADGRLTRLTDVCRVTYAPSARIVASCRQPGDRQRRGAAPCRRRDPTTIHGPLAGAGAEVTSVATLFGDRVDQVRVEAMRAFLLEEVIEPTHIHAACHARGDIADFTRSTLILGTANSGFEQLRGAAWHPSSWFSQRARRGLPISHDSGRGVLDRHVHARKRRRLCARSLWEVDDYATAVLNDALLRGAFRRAGNPSRDGTRRGDLVDATANRTRPRRVHRSRHGLGQAFSDDGAVFWRCEPPGTTFSSPIRSIRQDSSWPGPSRTRSCATQASAADARVRRPSIGEVAAAEGAGRGHRRSLRQRTTMVTDPLRLLAARRQRRRPPLRDGAPGTP